MPSVKAGKLAKGLYILYKSEPRLITKTAFGSHSRGGAHMKVKLKGVHTGKSVEVTFKSNEQVEMLDVENKGLQFLYRDGDEVICSDPNTYEQTTLPISLFNDKIGYLGPDVKIYVLFAQEKAIGVSFPAKVKLEVTKAEAATAGNRVTAGKKPVVLETGLKIQAPLFVQKGDTLIIDTDTGQYVSRG